MYNNPMYYNNFYPYQNSYNNENILRKGLGIATFKKINWSNFLNNTQKTLNVINQAIPVYYQVKPIWGNAKTMLRMVNALKDEKPSSVKEEIKKETSEGPVFFL